MTELSLVERIFVVFLVSTFKSDIGRYEAHTVGSLLDLGIATITTSDIEGGRHPSSSMVRSRP